MVTYVSVSRDFAESATKASVHLPLARVEGNVRRTTSKPLNFVQTFCMFACIVLPLSVKHSGRGFRTAAQFSVPHIFYFHQKWLQGASGLS